MGLFGLDDDVRLGLLAAGLGTLAGRGSPMQTIGRGGLLGLQTYTGAKADREKARREQEREAAQMELIRAQIGNYASQNQERQAKIAKDQEAAAQAAALQQQLAGAFLPDVSRMGPGGPTPQNLQQITPDRIAAYRRQADIYAQAGRTEEAKRLDDIADRMQEAFSQTPQTLMRNGQPVSVVQGNRGTTKELTGYEPPPDMQSVSQGDRVSFIDKLRTTPGTFLPVNISPTDRARFAMADATRAQAQATRDAATINARTSRLNADTQALSKHLDANAIPSLMVSMQGVQELLDQYPKGTNIPGLGKIEGNIPDILRGPESNRARSRIQAVVNDLLKLYSGGAVTPNEAERRMVEMLASGKYSDEDFRNAWPIVVGRFNKTIESMRGGYSPETIAEYEARSGVKLAPIQPSTKSGGQAAPQVGERRDGYTFIGGDPADPKSWRKD